MEQGRFTDSIVRRSFVLRRRGLLASHNLNQVFL
jgi:hypothetical protein